MRLKDSVRSGVNRQKLKFIFFWVFAFGLVAHGFRYFNGNFNHDSLYSIYESSPDVNIAVGRFLRPVYRLLRGGFTLPVINGFLSLFFLSLAIYLLTDILDIQHKGLLALTCGILTTNATISLMNATFLHDADSYMVSLLLTLAGVWIARRLKHGIYYSTLFYFASLGIYQAYINVAIYVFLILALVRLLKGERVKKVYLDTVRYFLPIMAGMVLYYIGIRVTQHFTHLSDGDYYNTLSNVTAFSLGSIFERLNTCIFSDAVWFFVPTAHAVGTVRAVNILMLALAAFLIIAIARCRRLSAASVWGILGVLAAIPFGMNAITLISNLYHALTLFALYLSYVCVLVLSELYLEMAGDKKPARRGQWACTVLACVLVFDSCLFSNETYLKKELENDATLSTFTRIISRMESTPGFVPGQTRVAFVGLLLDGPLSYGRPGFNYVGTGLWQSYNTTYHDTYETYLCYYLGYPADCVDSSEIVEFEQLEQVAAMHPFPADDSVQMVGDVLVIKLSDILEADDADEAGERTAGLP
ncbi:MAG: glucosyltransferase domain-containing protein [Faecousia sp.]